MRRNRLKLDGYRLRPSERRWYQFSLRTLLIVLTLFAAGVACVKIMLDYMTNNWVEIY